MHNPLVIEAIMLIAAIIVGVWSQRALPLHADSRPILFLLCLFLGTGSALCLLLDILALLLTGQVATGGVRIYGPLLLLVVLWKPLNWVVGIIEDFVQRRAEKGKGKASTTAVNADPPPAPWLIYSAFCILMTERAFEALVASTSITPVRNAPRIAVAFVLSEAIAMTQGMARSCSRLKPMTRSFITVSTGLP